MGSLRSFRPGMVVFAGAGPGDPELLTLRARSAIEQADLLVYADSLVHPGVTRFAKEGAEVIGSSGLTLEEIVGLMIEAARAGKLVVRLQSGDPSLYGAIHEQMVRLDEAGVEYGVIPGVSSVFACAAAIGAELTVPGISQTVILTRLPSRTSAPERERLRDLASHGGTVALFLSVNVIERAVAELIEAGFGPDTAAVVAHRVTWEDERILRAPLSEIAADCRRAKLTKQATVIVGQAVATDATAGGRSSLYHPSYSHSFRCVNENGTR